MTRQQMLARTKAFSLTIIRLVDAIPQTRAGNTIANQIVRSGTSVGANYRSACRPKSDKDFINKMVILEEEADETALWLELLEESGLVPRDVIYPIWKEADELTAIFVASARTVRERLKNSDARQPVGDEISSLPGNP